MSVVALAALTPVVLAAVAFPAVAVAAVAGLVAGALGTHIVQRRAPARSTPTVKAPSPTEAT